MTINEVKDDKVLGYSPKWGAHLNYMAGINFDINHPLVRLHSVAASCLFGEPSYYKKEDSKRKTQISGRFIPYGLSSVDKEYLRSILNAYDFYTWRSLTPAKTIEKCIDLALDFDIEKTLQLAVDLRQRDNIRVTPQIILVRAANHKFAKGGKPGSLSTPKSLITKYAPQIIRRADEPATGLAYQLAVFGKPIPNTLKRAWSKYLKYAKEYSLAKYRMEKRSVKTVDVGNLSYGKGLYGYNTPIGKLMRGELHLGGSNVTWESMRSEGKSWEECIPVMGHMALLRNIRNFTEYKVDINLWKQKFLDGAAKGRQLPFRYYSAYNILRSLVSPDILDTLEEAMMISLEFLDPIPGKSLVLSDNSGSTQGCPISQLSSVTVAQIGNLMGILTAQLSDEGYSGVFGDRLKVIPVRKRSSIFEMQDRLNCLGEDIGYGTENGVWLAFDEAIRNKIHYDNIFVYSDMQAGHGGLYGIRGQVPFEFSWKTKGRQYIDVPLLVKTYREQVNKNVNVFLIQIAGYEDTLMPEYYERTFILGGWSGEILRFASKMAAFPKKD